MAEATESQGCVSSEMFLEMARGDAVAVKCDVLKR